MGYLNLDIKEGSFDDIGASGSIDGMCEDYVPSWDIEAFAKEAEKKLEEEWDYEG